MYTNKIFEFTSFFLFKYNKHNRFHGRRFQESVYLLIWKIFYISIGKYIVIVSISTHQTVYFLFLRYFFLLIYINDINNIFYMEHYLPLKV